jgi:hypothetical protein
MGQILSAIISGAATVAAVVVTGWFNSRATGKVHKIVNQQRTDGQRYAQDLRSALTAAGVPVPPDQSLPAEQPPPS